MTFVTLHVSAVPGDRVTGFCCCPWHSQENEQAFLESPVSFNRSDSLPSQAVCSLPSKRGERECQLFLSLFLFCVCVCVSVLHVHVCALEHAKARGGHRVCCSVSLHLSPWSRVSDWIWSWAGGQKVPVMPLSLPLPRPQPEIMSTCAATPL